MIDEKLNFRYILLRNMQRQLRFWLHRNKIASIAALVAIFTANKIYKVYTRDAMCTFSVFAVNIETFVIEISRRAIIRDVWSITMNL
jgi:hypothetical protein